uniref:Hexosyltransferase n=1 Tax=Salarias fasciatus TaxID=181472 RepID=A0A672FF86_SALFA
MQNGAQMPTAGRRIGVFYVMLTVFLCGLLIGSSWNLGHDKGSRQRNPPLPPGTAPLGPPQVWDYNTLPQKLRDFLLHMRCRSYPVLLNQLGACAGKPFLLLAVKWLVPHLERRQAIRETRGRAGVVWSRTVVTLFLLGSAASSHDFPDLRGVLGHEAQTHRDLLQWDYRDTFFNLTLKDLLFHGRLTLCCPQAQSILKGDDDVFVNTRRIIEYLEGLSGVQAKDLFIGDVISGAGPQRDPKLKYFISESVFVGQYPPYAGGGGYLHSGQLALRLFNVSARVILYPIDGVYTGMCLRKLGLVPQRHVGFKTFGTEKKYRRNPCAHRTLTLVHSRTPGRVFSWLYLTENPFHMGGSACFVFSVSCY